MKILAFSDLHRDKKAASVIAAASAEADLVVGAGDFGTAGEGIGDVIAILREITAPSVLVSGNHDNLDDLRAACRGWASCTILHGENTIIDGVSFFGIGMEIPRRADFAWNSHMSEDDAGLELSKCPDDAILVTHSPPYGGACDIQSNGAHEGSTAIQAAVRNKRPRLCLCGHIHHSWGSEYSIGRSRVINLGPSLNWFEI